MLPRLSLRPAIARRPASTSVCFFCSVAAPRSRPRAPARDKARKRNASRRLQSTTTTRSSSSSRSRSPRQQLLESLLALQKRAPSYVDQPRLQLAIHGLQQPAGQETVRVLVATPDPAQDNLGLGQMTKEMLRLLLADPLSPEQEWEKQLAEHDIQQPIVIRVGPKPTTRQPEPNTVTISRGEATEDLHVSCPTLNSLNLEILLSSHTDAAATSSPAQVPSLDALECRVTMRSGGDRHEPPVTTQVHKCIQTQTTDPEESHVWVVTTDMPSLKKPRLATLASQASRIDLEAAAEGLKLFRQSTSNAKKYEELWHESNITAVLSSLRDGAEPLSPGTSKPVFRHLVSLLLHNARTSIQNAEPHTLVGDSSSSKQPDILALRLASWSQAAHEELQEQLEVAFAGRRWRKLGWWKLFWRVDDVAFLTSEILAQRFLPNAERELVYLAGEIQGVRDSVGAKPTLYEQPKSQASEDAQEMGGRSAKGHSSPAEEQQKWPTHISFTRRYLNSETVPALQALAQKLILQASSTTALSTSLAGLLYLSASVSTLYEAGAVAAFGLVWSLRRLQRKWETAREFWEGEVREEGRKAVRGAEASVSAALREKVSGLTEEELADLEVAKGLVEEGEEALRKME